MSRVLSSGLSFIIWAMGPIKYMYHYSVNVILESERKKYDCKVILSSKVSDQTITLVYFLC